MRLLTSIDAITDDHAVTAFVALGSNLEDPVAKIRGGLAAIAKLPLTRLVRSSSLYRNPPVGFLDQPDFVNAVAMIETGLGPRELLDALLGIELAHGRARSVPNAPRTLDLDLALYGERVIEEPGLVVPHPRLPSAPSCWSPSRRSRRTP